MRYLFTKKNNYGKMFDKIIQTKKIRQMFLKQDFLGSEGNGFSVLFTDDNVLPFQRDFYENTFPIKVSSGKMNN